MRRMAMAFHMAGMDRFSTGRRFPQLDRIALRVVDTGKVADAWIIPLRLGDDFDPAASKAFHKSLEPIHSKVDHPLAVLREIVGVVAERRKDRRSRLLLPHSVIAADSQMVQIPALERFRVVRPKEDSAYSGDPHGILLMKSAGGRAAPAQACPHRDSRARRPPEVRAPTD